MNIDWSKAPEGATHYDPVDNNWLRQVANTAHVWCGGGTGWGEKTCQYNNDLSTMRRLIARTTPWNGEGLPPVGTKVEFFNNQEWVIVEILFLTDITILIRLIDDFGRQECALHPDHCKFRPIATPDQIAAEEREKAINEMVALSPMLDKGWARKVCTAVYDAGYRKQEQPK